MRPGLNGIDLTGWAVPRYKTITRCRVEDHARIKLLDLLSTLEEVGLPDDEIEYRMLRFREESLAGLNYMELLLAEEFGLEKEETTQRVKRVKKKKRPKRGGLFG